MFQLSAFGLVLSVLVSFYYFAWIDIEMRGPCRALRFPCVWIVEQSVSKISC